MPNGHEQLIGRTVEGHKVDSTPSVWNPDLGNGQFQNPIIHADYSDPDVVRVGGDFYMVSSSFSHMPALPVLHSHDLVNWRIVNHVFARLELPGYDEVQHGKGVWAPSIRYHAGLFWVYFSTPDEGVFMCTAQDPCGKWSAPHCVKQAKGWIDPCPFWDEDGRAWLVHAFAFSRSGVKHRLQLCAMSADGRELLDEGRIIYDGSADHPTLEGPKVYKRGAWHYILAPAGGVATGWQVALRARTIDGPYEARVVLHQGATAINGPHQGGLVELANGQHWFVHFQDAFAYGRIVHLQPVTWLDDWPVIGEQADAEGAGQPVLRYAKPQVSIKPSDVQAPQTSDEFADDVLGLQWQWQANPQAAWYDLDARGLTLNCVPLADRANGAVLYDAPNLLLQKFPARSFVVTTTIKADLRADGEQAGLVVFGERYASLALRRENGRLRLVQRFGWINDQQKVEEADLDSTDGDNSAQWTLRVRVDRDARCIFEWSPDGQQFQACARRFAAGPGRWVGAKVGLFAIGRGDNDHRGSASFKYFRVSPEAVNP